MNTCRFPYLTYTFKLYIFAVLYLKVYGIRNGLFNIYFVKINILIIISVQGVNSFN